MNSSNNKMNVINPDGSVNRTKFTIKGMELEIVGTSFGDSWRAIDAHDTIRNHTTGKETIWHRRKLKEITDKICSNN
jgi:hypothetical protein